jgi:hypothetical protein
MVDQSNTMVGKISRHARFLLIDNRNELLVAAQLVETPKIPYFEVYAPMPLPEKVMHEAERLMSDTISNVGPLSQPLYSIVRLLHQLGAIYTLPAIGVRLDPYVIGPLYKVQYSLVQILSIQRKTQNLSSKEWMLAQTFLLYFELGPRGLPPHGAIMHVFVSRVAKAFTCLLAEQELEDTESASDSDSASHLSYTVPVLSALNLPISTRNAVAWCLSLVTNIAMRQNHPKHPWLKARLQAHLQDMGLDKDEEKYGRMLDMFPTTICYPWINLRTPYAPSRS